MVKLLGAFSRLKSAKILVVGDFMLDTYTSGKVDRISPEAPVPILHVQKTSHLPGGAGNVALNLKALGADVLCSGRVGADLEGKRLTKLLQSEDINTDGLLIQKKMQTPVKTRLIAGAQQLMRVDDETLIPIEKSLENEVIAFIEKHLDEIQVIAISDYGKGFLSPTLLNAIISAGRRQSVPVIVDPKGDDFNRYKSATLIKPNLKEAIEAAKLGREATLDEIGAALIRLTLSEHIMVTRSEAGITLFDKEEKRVDFPVKSREVIDVTGAGDTVLAMTAMSYAAELSLPEGIMLANVAASIAVERVGCARVSLADIAERLLETNNEYKVFDEEHLFALEQALKEKQLTVLGINTQDGISASLFAKIRSLSSPDPNEKLMIYLVDETPDEHFISLLSSLHEIDFIVIKSDSLASLCARIHPSKAFILENGIIVQVSHFEELTRV